MGGKKATIKMSLPKDEAVREMIEEDYAQRERDNALYLRAIAIDTINQHEKKHKEETTDMKKHIDTLKDGVYEVAALPMTHPIKRVNFKNKLKSDEFLSSYIDKNCINKLSRVLNEHMKAGLIYSYHYIKTFNQSSPATNEE